MGDKCSQGKKEMQAQCAKTDIFTLISYKIKEASFTVQETNVLIAVISKIKCDLSSAP